jgi:hypothetical protein
MCQTFLFKILYEAKDVYIHEPKFEEENDRLIESKKVGGRLQLVKNVNYIFIQKTRLTSL